jgi:catechol 2,3-dioxygenase-like lactoylglutathione lyase family enzyme
MNATRLLILLLTSCALFAQVSPERPRILGIAHVAVHTSDFGKTRVFYQDFLGFAEAFTLKRPDSTDCIAYIKVNDRQYVELSSDQQAANQLNHFALYTDNAAGMRDYLVRRGIKVLGPVHKGNIGNDFFSVRDPDGHLLEIVQYQRDSWTGQDQGAHMPAGRISDHIAQIGIRVGAEKPTLQFYQEIFGLVELSSGKASATQNGWINLRVPDGTDTINFLLYRNLSPMLQPSVHEYVRFARSDVPKAISELQVRSALHSTWYQGSIPFPTNQTQFGLFDPDGTLIEITQPDVAGVAFLPYSASSPR